MFDNNNSRSIQNRPFVVLSVIAVVAVVSIVTISLLVTTFSNHQEANIVNESGAQEISDISDEDMTRVKKELYRFLNDSAGANHEFDVSVRWDTVAHTSTTTTKEMTFMVDIDEYQQSYRVILNPYVVYLQCPELGESKYPSSYCIGNSSEGDNSTSVVFGELLPYTGETSEGELFSLERPYINGIQYADTPDLNVYVSACSDTDAAKERARAAAEEYINSLGAPSDLFNLKVSLAGGCHGE